MFVVGHLQRIIPFRPAGENPIYETERRIIRSLPVQLQCLFLGTGGICTSGLLGNSLLQTDKISFKSSFKPITLIDFQLYDGQIEVEHVDISKGQKLRMPTTYDKTFFTIYYSIPELESPDRYSFRIIWKDLIKCGIHMNKKCRTPTFTPGKYTFHIRSTNSRGGMEPKHVRRCRL